MRETHKRQPKKKVRFPFLTKKDKWHKYDIRLWTMASDPKFQYRPKLFDDPRNTSWDKENAPSPLESVTPPPTIVISEEEFLDRTDKVLAKDAKWEAHVGQQIPLPRSSSPYLDDRPGALEQLEPEMDEDIEIVDYMERITNDKRPPKPKCGPSLMIQNFCPTLQTSSNYIAMTAAAELVKQCLREIRGILPEKKKMPCSWLACLKKMPPKVAFRNNDIYLVRSSDKDDHHYEEPQEKQEPQDKNMWVFTN